MIYQLTTYFEKVATKIGGVTKIQLVLWLSSLVLVSGCAPNTFFTPTSLQPIPILSLTATPTLIKSTPPPTSLPIVVTGTIFPEVITPIIAETITPIASSPFLPTPLLSTVIPSDTPLIIALSEEDNNSILYTMGLDGKLGQSLTDSIYFSSSPVWSPDCQQIAFLRDFGISIQLFIIDISTHQMKQVETPFEIVSSPDWSPDGNALVFAAGNFDAENYGDLSAQIYIVDLVTQELRQLTNEGQNYEPHWSPDGQSIVYEHYADNFSPSSIYIMDVDAENKRQVVPESWGADTLKDPSRNSPKRPIWSPDNRWIAFSVDETTFIYGFKAEKTYLVRPDGSNLHRLVEGDSENIDVESEGFFYISELYPVWSPDSQTMFYVETTSYRPQPDNYCFADVLSGTTNCIPQPSGIINDMDWCSLPAIHSGTE